jgi:hypothetical protein
MRQNRLDKEMVCVTMVAAFIDNCVCSSRAAREADRGHRRLSANDEPHLLHRG